MGLSFLNQTPWEILILVISQTMFHLRLKLSITSNSNMESLLLVWKNSWQSAWIRWLKAVRHQNFFNCFQRVMLPVKIIEDTYYAIPCNRYLLGYFYNFSSHILYIEWFCVLIFWQLTLKPFEFRAVLASDRKKNKMLSVRFEPAIW